MWIEMFHKNSKWYLSSTESQTDVPRHTKMVISMTRKVMDIWIFLDMPHGNMT